MLMTFIQQLINGLMLGGSYALVAIGYTLIFGVLNLLHLAHGEVAMIGSYVGWTGALSTLFLGSVLAAGVSLILVALRRTTLQDYVPFGPALVIAGAVTLLWGSLL